MALTQISTQGIKDGTITGTDIASNLDLADNQRLRIGTGNDLQLWHDSGYNFIDAVSGVAGFYIRGRNNTIFQQPQLKIRNDANTEDIAKFIENGAVELYYDNSKKFETTNSGVTVTGGVAVTANISVGSDTGKLYLGASNDLEIFHTGTASKINNATGTLLIQSDAMSFHGEGGSETMAVFTKNGAVELYYDNSKKFESTSAGATVTGSLGIGTTSPSNNLHVHQGDSDKSIAQFTNTETGTASGDGFQIGITSSEEALLNMKESKSILFKTADTERMLITSVGNVEIDSFNSPSTRTLSLRTGYAANANGGIGIAAKDHSGAAADGLGIYGTDGVSIHTANAGTVFERMRIDTSGRVGIGTTSPAFKLDITGSGTGNGSTLNINDAASSADSRHIKLTRASTAAYIGIAGSVANDPFFISRTGNNSDLVIDSSGNVGINQSNPNKARLHVVGDNTSDDIIAKFKSGGGGANSTSFIALVTGYPDDANDYEGHAYIGVQRNGATNNTKILFKTYSGDSGGAMRTRMTIEPGNNIDIQGKIHTQLGTQINSFNKETTGDQIRFNTTGTTRGSISSNGSTVAFNTSASDRSMKKNFENWTEDTLNLFKNINPQKFNFLDQEDGTNKEKGFIAQDMVASFPEAYIKNDDDKYMFNASGMVVYLMKAIQELEAEVAALKAS